MYWNTLVFLALDKTSLQGLDEAARRFLAWESVVGEKDSLDLTPHQARQAEMQKSAADGTVDARLPEAYQWLLVPGQSTPQSPVEWQAVRLPGTEALAVRAGKRLKNGELLLASFGSSLLRMELDRVPLWRGDHVHIRQVVEDFAKYLYLPRLKGSSVLLKAVKDGVALMTWPTDSFAYAESYDGAAGRYRGLQACKNLNIHDANTPSLLVKPDVACLQFEVEEEDRKKAVGASGGAGKDPNRAKEDPLSDPLPDPVKRTQPKFFRGSVVLDETRVGRDASRIADEVITHLAGLLGANVKVTLEIEAEMPAGVPDQAVRAVTENSRTLKFTTHGFEAE